VEAVRVPGYVWRKGDHRPRAAGSPSAPAISRFESTPTAFLCYREAPDSMPLPALHRTPLGTRTNSFVRGPGGRITMASLGLPVPVRPPRSAELRQEHAARFPRPGGGSADTRRRGQRGRRGPESSQLHDLHGAPGEQPGCIRHSYLRCGRGLHGEHQWWPCGTGAGACPRHHGRPVQSRIGPDPLLRHRDGPARHLGRLAAERDHDQGEPDARLDGRDNRSGSGRRELPHRQCLRCLHRATHRWWGDVDTVLHVPRPHDAQRTGLSDAVAKRDVGSHQSDLSMAGRAPKAHFWGQAGRLSTASRPASVSPTPGAARATFFWASSYPSRSASRNASP
jgi:hypothetical protein